MADKGWLQNGNAKAGMWSALHFQYSLASAPIALPMVQGEFVNE
jgi:hypothetical protein